MIGPGKYEDACTIARCMTNAAATLLIIFDGNRWTGFSAQMTPDMMSLVPGVLRTLADKIDADRRRYDDLQFKERDT